MLVFEQLEPMRKQVKSWKQNGQRIGFVPTMGNLHAGHLSLVKQALSVCDQVVVSIFVNPLQFGPDEDFERYPRTFETDKHKLKEAGVSAVFAPSVETMYPVGAAQTLVKAPQSLTGLLEGAERPGHFDGVTTVVCKLFNMVQPDLAVFGQKDYQQFCVIREMVRDLSMPIELLMGAIERDTDGLALSSRNQYLTEKQREIAPKLYTVLQDIESALQSGNRNFRNLEDAAASRLLQEGFDSVDYVQVSDAETLMPPGSKTRLFAVLGVARLGETRLLDNILLNHPVHVT